jgi:hypothetical protein
MTHYRALLPVALALATSFSPRAFAGAGFNDGNFETYTWTAVKILDTTAGSTFSAGEVPSGGVGGGAYRSNSFSFTYSGTPLSQEIIIANTNNGMTYSPAVSGPINSIYSFSILANYWPGAGAPVTDVGLLLVQNGTFYTNQLTAIAGFNTPYKNTTPQYATDFIRVGSSGASVNPDFSGSGAPIQFGCVITASLSSGSPATISGVAGVDDYSLSISNTPIMPLFTSQQSSSATNLLVTLSGLANQENITWMVSTNLTNWFTNNPTSQAVATNGTFTVTNWISPAPTWFLRALVW